MNTLKLIGPFRQILTMDAMPWNGPLSDANLQIVEEGGILVNDQMIKAVGTFHELEKTAASVERMDGDYVLIPGMVDMHTHICWAGNRSSDYAMRLSGKSYNEIGEKGGGIWSTVTKTRAASHEQLSLLTSNRASQMLSEGITTIEVKSGYGLNPESEIKILEAIQEAQKICKAHLIPTCLAAHIKPHDFEGNSKQYLEYVIDSLLPVIKNRHLSNRVDIYVDHGAFDVDESRFYLTSAQSKGFQLVVHANQFSPGGVHVAVEMNALSADHLEFITEEEIQLLAHSHVMPVALPGASMGLGMSFAPARKLLDAGASLAIASDWNPGTAPMGNLLMQASVMGAYEKLSMAETLAAITCRASRALGLSDRGQLRSGMQADFIAFPATDFREIIYYQGALKAGIIWKNGERI